jgi:hypothetical protein
MKSQILGFVLLAAAAVVASAPAQAQNGSLTRSFVSSSGVDTNPCTVTQPCASFAHAYTAVGPSGIVAALDPGKYGPLTIYGPVTIDGNGWAAITAPANSNGITINAQPSDKITLKGLAIDGVGTANNGILFNTGAGLNVFDCTIKNTLDNGIYVGVLNGVSLLVSNTFISNVNSETNSSGIYLYNGANGSTSAMTVTLDRVMINDASVGVSAYTTSAPLLATITNSEIATSPTGFVAQGGTYSVSLVIKNFTWSGGETSLNLQGNTVVYLSQAVAPNLSYISSGSNYVFCDGTNHVSACNETWSAQ